MDIFDFMCFLYQKTRTKKIEWYFLEPEQNNGRKAIECNLTATSKVKISGNDKGTYTLEIPRGCFILDSECIIFVKKIYGLMTNHERIIDLLINEYNNYQEWKK